MMNRIAVAVIVGAVAGYAHASPLPDYPFVYADGTAEEKLAPNTCTVVYQIKVRDKDPTNGMQTLEARSAETIELLATHGVKKEDIVGFEISKERVRDYVKQDRLEYLGYEITRHIAFTLRELQKYEPIMSVLLKTPDVTDINTSFERLDRKEIESRLTARAVADARTNAQAIANGAGQRIVKLRAVSQNGFANIGAAFGLGQGDFHVRASQDIRPPQKELLFIPSTIKFSSSVYVIYEVEEKK